jgi:hypothetical protein
VFKHGAFFEGDHAPFIRGVMNISLHPPIFVLKNREIGVRGKEAMDCAMK